MDGYHPNMSAFVLNARSSLKNNLLFDLLEKVAIKYDDYYVFNYIAYRKIFYYNLFEPFAETLKPFYIKKRQFYVTKRPITYNMVTTIIRQFCTLKDIDYTIATTHQSKHQEYRIYIPLPIDTKIKSLR